MASYWVEQWADELGVKSSAHARLALSNKKERARLIEIAESAVLPEYSQVRYGQQLLAGHSMDLSGTFHCCDGECLQANVDQLLLRSWHYFDNVVVAGVNPGFFGVQSAKALADPNSMTHRELLGQLDVLFHLRAIGADSLVTFVPKPLYCTEHIQKHAHDAGLETDIEATSVTLRSKLLEHGQVHDVKHHKTGETSWAFSSPFISTVQTYRHQFDSRPKKLDLREFSAAAAARDYVAAHTLSASLARDAGLPLGDSVADARQMELSAGAQAGDVAFNLELPVMQELPISEILAVREQHMDDFIAFRSAVRSAIEERLKALPDANADQIADSVYDDIIERELINLHQTFMKALDGINKRRSAAGIVSSTMLTVGLTAFSSIIATGISVGAGALFTAYSEWLNKRDQVETSDLRFLWRLDDRVEKLRHGH